MKTMASRRSAPPGIHQHPETGACGLKSTGRTDGYAELERDLSNARIRPIDEHRGVGKRVSGIRRNDLYIFTHREFKGARTHDSHAVFPDEEINRTRR
jgi:hypothetical protein